MRIASPCKGKPPVTDGFPAQESIKAGNFCICDVIKNTFDHSRESDTTNAYWFVSVCSIMGYDHNIMTTCHISSYHHLSQWRPASMMITTIKLHSCWYKEAESISYEHKSHASHMGFEATFCDVTGLSWHLKLQSTRTYFWKIVQAKNKETYALQTHCKGKPPVTDGFPTQGAQN